MSRRIQHPRLGGAGGAGGAGGVGGVGGVGGLGGQFVFQYFVVRFRACTTVMLNQG